jgi:anti-repressor protein
MTTLLIVGSQEMFGKTVIAFGTIEKPLFPAKDVAEWIEHRDISSMLRSVDEDEKVRVDGEILDPAQFAESGNLRTSRWYLTEEGLYEVLMLSRKPAAKEFKKGVKKMLHDIRTGKAQLTRPLVGNELIRAGYAEAMKLIERQQTTIVTQQSQIAADRPKVEFANAVGECQNGKGLREFAISLKQNGIVRNEHEFIDWLLQRKYLYRNQKGTLMPFAQFVKEEGYFWLKTVVTENTCGEKTERFQVKITAKGQQHLQQRLLKERDKTPSLESDEDPFHDVE